MYRKGNIFNLLRKLNRPSYRGTFGLSTSEFEAAFQREKSLADRSLRSFTMVIFLPRGEDEDLEGLGEILKDRLRVSDIAGRLDAGLLAVLLPETDERGANVMADAVMIQLAEAGLKFDFKVYLYQAKGGRSNGSVDRDDEEGPGSGAATPLEGIDSLRKNGSAHSQNGHAAKNGILNGHGSTQHGGEANIGDEPEPAEEVAAVAGGSLFESSSDDREWLELGEVRSSVGAHRAQDLRPLCCEPLSFRKRALDIAVAGSLLILLSPLFLLVSLAVWLTSPGPVFFVQQRAGQGGIPFDFYKFRSMYVDAEHRKAALACENEQDGPIFKIKNDPRMTPIGRFLRHSSIDELPQLYNVLIGDMTLVGPRPPTLDEVEKYEPWQLGRLCLKGGLTCIWQVSGRSEIGFEEWVRMDLRYAQRRGLAMDLGLLARTANAVVTGRGAY